MPNRLPLEEILDNLREGVYVTDRERVIRYWNKGAEGLSGFSKVEAMWHSCKDGLLTHVDQNGRSLCEDGCPLQKTLEDGMVREADVLMHHKDGHLVPVHVTATPIRDEKGEIVAVAETFHDDSEVRKARETIAELERQSMVDTMTGLPNRKRLEEHLKQRLEERERHHWPLAVFMADIDHFKWVNDEHGHDVGDQVIKMVGASLAASERATDLVGRLGGDEFLGIMALCKPQGIVIFGERMRKMVEQSYLTIEGKRLGVTVSMGFAEAKDGETPEGLIKRADQSLYESKRAGGNRVSVWQAAA